MSQATKGWRCRVKVCANPQDEDMQGSPAIAGQTTFYSKNFPITNNAGVVTDDENLVKVYVGGVVQAAVAYTLTGSLGRIVFGVAPGAASRVTIDYYYQYEIAYGRSTEVTIDSGTEELHVLGMRTPKEILEGAVTIRGALERYFVSRDFIGKMTLDIAGDKGQTAFVIFLWPLGQITGKPVFTLRGIKFDPWVLSVPDPNTETTERLGYKGISIETGLVA